MPTIVLSNGQRIKVKADHDKLVKKIIKNETIDINGVTIFTKHILEVERDS